LLGKHGYTESVYYLGTSRGLEDIGGPNGAVAFRWDVWPYVKPATGERWTPDGCRFREAEGS